MMYRTVEKRVETDRRGMLIENHSRMMETHPSGNVDGC
jgi:hypothetical protein